MLRPMITRMPRWVWSGAWVLAFIAGMINVVGFLSPAHQAITHLTGTTSMLAAALANSDGVAAFRFACVLCSFVGGTIISGFIIQDSTLKLGRRYSVALILESFLLCLAVLVFNHFNDGGVYLAACACGIQNAMVSTYSGAVVRTTHVSGMFTDLGISLGHALRGLPVNLLRLRLCALIISAFLSGGIAGAFAFRYLGFSTLLLPAAITGVTALAYALYSIHRER